MYLCMTLTDLYKYNYLGALSFGMYFKTKYISRDLLPYNALQLEFSLNLIFVIIKSNVLMLHKNVIAISVFVRYYIQMHEECYDQYLQPAVYLLSLKYIFAELLLTDQVTDRFSYLTLCVMVHQKLKKYNVRGLNINPDNKGVCVVRLDYLIFTQSFINTRHTHIGPCP